MVRWAGGQWQLVSRGGGWPDGEPTRSTGTVPAPSGTEQYYTVGCMALLFHTFRSICIKTILWTRNTICFTIFVHRNFRRKSHSDCEYQIVPRPRKWGLIICTGSIDWLYITFVHVSTDVYRLWPYFLYVNVNVIHFVYLILALRTENTVFLTHRWVWWA